MTPKQQAQEYYRKLMESATRAAEWRRKKRNPKQPNNTIK